MAAKHRRRSILAIGASLTLPRPTLAQFARGSGSPGAVITPASDNAVVTWNWVAQTVGSGNGNVPYVTDANGDTWTLRTSGVGPQFPGDLGARIYKNSALFPSTAAPIGLICLRGIPRTAYFIRNDIPTGGAFILTPEVPSGSGVPMVGVGPVPPLSGSLPHGDFFPTGPWNAAFPSPDDSTITWDPVRKIGIGAAYLRDGDGCIWQMVNDPAAPLFAGDQGCRLYYNGTLYRPSAGRVIVDLRLRFSPAAALYSVAGAPPGYFSPNGNGGQVSWGKLSEIPPVLPSGAANNGNGTQVTKPVNWTARTLDPRSSPLPGTGKTWTVGPGGNYATITAALDARTTMDGDTIRVLAGTYGPGNPFDLTPGAAGGAGFNVNKAVLIDGGLNHMDFSTFNNNTGSCAGYSGGHPFSGFGAIVPGTVRSIPFGTPTQWAINTAYPATTTVSNNALPVAVINGGNVYVIVTPGTSASSGRGPTGAGSSISDGTAVWQYVQTYKECIIKNFIISHVGLDLGGFGSLGAVRANSAGRLTIDNCYFFGCQVGVDYSNYPGAVLTVQNCVQLNNGLAYRAPSGKECGFGGNSHNIYITNIGQFNLIRDVSTRPIEAHAVKCRANEINMTDVMSESQHGACLDMANGGNVTVTGTGGSVWMKTPSASGRGDKTITDYADEWYPGADAVYSVSNKNLVSNTILSIQNPISTIRYPAYFSKMTFDGTCTWYNSNVPLLQGNSNQFAGVPTARTAAKMSLSQLNSVLAVITAQMNTTIKTMAYMAAYFAFYDVQLPPCQASIKLTGSTGPAAGDTITVTSHPNVNPTHGVPYCAIATPLAVFTCSNPNLQNVQYTTTVNWGDGSAPNSYDNWTTATGTSTIAPGNTTGPTIKVYGAHTYANAGTYTVTVIVSEASPGTGTATTALTATVA